MKRLHVHLHVEELEKSVRFYRTLFGVAPSKLKDDYAQWLLDEPSVNFAVSTKACCDAGISHLGIQVDDDASLAVITAALAEAEQTIFEEKENLCCYARGNKAWASDPDGVVWETFHRLGHSETMGRDDTRDAGIEALQESASLRRFPVTKA
ncbi:MAG: glyoxalase/bleomycin resistance/dioxygenase family protein [Defluviicoccus sp.]|nr:glyoxalase/bleomycin resistance/dioxygenase family protein [Defluviicoccus sp.]